MDGRDPKKTWKVSSAGHLTRVSEEGYLVTPQEAVEEMDDAQLGLDVLGEALELATKRTRSLQADIDRQTAKTKSAERRLQRYRNGIGRELVDRELRSTGEPALSDAREIKKLREQGKRTVAEVKLQVAGHIECSKMLTEAEKQIAAWREAYKGVSYQGPVSPQGLTDLIWGLQEDNGLAREEISRLKANIQELTGWAEKGVEFAEYLHAKDDGPRPPAKEHVGDFVKTPTTEADLYADPQPASVFATEREEK